MSSGVTLSASVRQNLISLQNTAAMMAATQNRLATGNKLNTALDNPTNFFTASSLRARSGDLSALLDSISNGIKVIEAANNGLTAIGKVLETMQSTVRQARQDNTTQAASYSIGTINTSSVQNLSLSGGAVGATPVDIALNTLGTAPSTVTASADYVAPVALSGPVATASVEFAPLDTTNGNETYSFTVSKNGGPAVNVQLNASDGSVGSIWTGEAVTGINADLTAGGSTIRVRQVNNGIWGHLEFYDTDAANTGTAATISVSDITTGGTTPSGTLGWEGGTLSGQGTDAANRVVTIGDGTTTATATLTSANAATAAAARTAIQAAIDATALVGTITVGGAANRINLTGLADGSNDIIVGGANVNDVFGAGRTVTPGSANAGAVKTVDELVFTINNTAALSGKVSASNDGGRLHINNLSATPLTVTGVTNGAIDGSNNTATVNISAARESLLTQFNELRTQLDTLARDSFFNGVNLLAGDQLKLQFNEINTSNMVIQTKNADGSNFGALTSVKLAIGVQTSATFQDNSQLDLLAGVLQSALGTLCTQAAALGSSLTMVQGRQKFTKSMMTTFSTGADALVVADSNEEGADMLALQTRQQLSTSALSMASQADRAVLRLFQ